MAATPKPVRKKVKAEMKSIRKVVDNPRHGYSEKQKKHVMKGLVLGRKKSLIYDRVK